jgi:hypothetical protein
LIRANELTDQRINGSTDQRINGSTDQRINGSTDQRVNESTPEALNVDAHFPLNDFCKSSLNAGGHYLFQRSNHLNGLVCKTNHAQYLSKRNANWPRLIK